MTPLTPRTGEVFIALVTTAGGLLLVPSADQDGPCLTLPTAPADRGLAARHLRRHLRAEICRVRALPPLPRTEGCEPVPVWSARIFGRRPGTWVWAPAGQAGQASQEGPGFAATPLSEAPLEVSFPVNGPVEQVEAFARAAAGDRTRQEEPGGGLLMQVRPAALRANLLAVIASGHGATALLGVRANVMTQTGRHGDGATDRDAGPV